MYIIISSKGKRPVDFNSEVGGLSKGGGGPTDQGYSL